MRRPKTQKPLFHRGQNFFQGDAARRLTDNAARNSAYVPRLSQIYAVKRLALSVKLKQHIAGLHAVTLSDLDGGDHA